MDIDVTKLDNLEKSCQEMIDHLYEHAFTKGYMPGPYGGKFECITGCYPHILEEIAILKEHLEYLKTLREKLIKIKK